MKQFCSTAKTVNLYCGVSRFELISNQTWNQNYFVNCHFSVIYQLMHYCNAVKHHQIIFTVFRENYNK